MSQPPELVAILTCPVCGSQKAETMPADRCIFFYECAACRSVFRPKPGDCCVYCSYSDKRCPPWQSGQCRREIRDTASTATRPQ
ncbi:MAG: GDCCVxC domain-containing (seleno)protein [Vicinamibacterales bacterium]